MQIYTNASTPNNRESPAYKCIKITSPASLLPSRMTPDRTMLCSIICCWTCVSMSWQILHFSCDVRSVPDFSLLRLDVLKLPSRFLSKFDMLQNTVIWLKSLLQI